MTSLDFGRFVASGRVDEFAAVVTSAGVPSAVARRATARRLAAAESVWQSARRERRCATCRGYGWHTEPTRAATVDVAARVRVCGCTAGTRFWAVTLDDPVLVRGLMGLDESGGIADSDGLFGKFSVNGREVRAWRTYLLAAETRRRTR